MIVPLKKELIQILIDLYFICVLNLMWYYLYVFIYFVVYYFGILISFVDKFPALKFLILIDFQVDPNPKDPDPQTKF